jgi:probable O-glycosylation ligase (exosortase A-associated)
VKGLILTYLIAAFGTVGALRFPLVGLYVYVGLAVLRPQYIFGFAGDLSSLSLYVGGASLIGWAGRGFGSWRVGRARPIIVALLAFFVWYTLSALQALDQSRALPFVVELSKLVLPFLVGVTMMKGEKDWRPLLWTIVLAQGYVGFEQNLNYVFKGFNSAADGFGGMDNNFFAVSLVSVLGPAIALMLSSKTWFSRGLAGLAAALILHTILLTFSRGAMLGLVAVGITAFVLMPKRPIYLTGLLVTVLLAVQFTGPQLYARYSTILASEEDRDASAESRLDLWKDCLKVIEAQPVFGVGPANWKVVAASYGWPEGKSAHSVWMETAAEVGVPGVLALMMFFGFAVVRLWPIARQRLTEENRYEVALATGIILSIVGFAVAGQFVSAPALEPPYYIVMLGAAMLKSRPRTSTAANPTGMQIANPAIRPIPQRSTPGSVSRARPQPRLS